MIEQILNDSTYQKTMKKISQIKFITDGKWDWEHGIHHAKQVAQYVKKILTDLGCNARTIECGEVTAILHDLGLENGEKKDHAHRSCQLAHPFLNLLDLSFTEKEEMIHAIENHSEGDQLESFIGASLTLADKLDVTYHRITNSSIQDDINRQFSKIKEVKIEINSSTISIDYQTEPDFDLSILKEWDKCIKIPIKVASYLNRLCLFKQNGTLFDHTFIFNKMN